VDAAESWVPHKRQQDNAKNLIGVSHASRQLPRRMRQAAARNSPAAQERDGCGQASLAV
jgi:hypothetical protein